MKGKLANLLFPPKCVFCHGFLKKGEETICRSCEEKLQPGRRPRHPAKGDFLKSCVAVLPYEDTVRQAVHRYKFSGVRGYGAIFGQYLAQCVKADFGEDPAFVVTWVPVSRRRRRERGYDQAELMAGALARELKLPCSAMLKKIRHTKKQSGIREPAERKANVLGAYQVLPASGCTGARILLVDDVYTTGATTSECARMLRMAGAREVHAAVFAARM